MAKEQWRTIEDFPSYDVSDQGRVRSWVNSRGNRQKEPHIIHQQLRKREGYLKVELWKDGKSYTRDVQRLVALAFIPNPENKPEVNHKNGDKQNNNVSNLEWNTRQENVQHAIRTGLFTPTPPEPKKKPIRIIETGEVFDSVSDCARSIGDSVTNILHAVDDSVLDHHSCKGLHFEYVEKEKPKKEPFLRDYQREAVDKMFTGSILNGGVGSGKSRTGLYYYFKEQGGCIDDNGYLPMSEHAKDLYIITTALKRDSLEWESELANFLISKDPAISYYPTLNVVIDSWNNIQKYQDIKDAFFIFDEDRVTGNGKWVKAFLKIAKSNDWIILSATSGDTWMDYCPVFIANGFYRNKTEFTREHCVYSRYTKFPKIEKYINTGRLIRLRNKILIDMDFTRHTISHHEDVYCTYDISIYKDIIKNRWDIYKNEPIQQASGLCYVLRRVVNEDESRIVKLLELLEDHPKAIIFYNFNYERDMLLHVLSEFNINGEYFDIAEWSGHAHEPVPDSNQWVYLVQYTAGCEGWNCIKTDTIIFYSQNYSYKVMEQASGRINRLNTPFKDLYYYHLKSRSGIDLAISKALSQKKKFNETRWVNGSH